MGKRQTIQMIYAITFMASVFDWMARDVDIPNDILYFFSPSPLLIIRVPLVHGTGTTISIVDI
jgi:hypothetical protein